MTEQEVAVRMAGRFTVDGECWVWTGSTTGGPRPYGQLRIDGRLEVAHRHVLGLTLGRPLGPDEHARHVRCRRTLCIRPCHLAAGTQLDNMRDRDADGTTARGERNGKAQLTADDVREIRRRHLAGTAARALAREYGVSHTSLDAIVKRRSWRSVA